jgi:tyrosine-protein kinase Etk/Wzc
MQGKKISILDLVLILIERKRFFVFSMTVIAITAVVITFLLPKHYTASASLLPSTNSPLKNPFSALLTDIPLNSMMKSLDFLESSDNDQILAILGSRRIADKVIQQFNLIQRYKFHKRKKYFIEDVIREFNRNYDVIETDLKNINISFTDTNPEFSARVVNFIVNVLDSINSEISRNNARNTRLFFENRLKIVKEDMDSAHQRFAAFQQEHNYIDLEQQVISSIDALSKIEAQILNNDINIEFLKNRYGKESYEVKELFKNRRILKRQMAHYLDSGSGELIIPLKSTPKLGITYTYLMRDVKVQEMLHTFLLQNFEQAKLSEANNTPTVNVLEYAMVPQKKSRPKRAIICLLIFFSGLIVVSMVIFILKWYEIQSAGNTEAYSKVATLLSHLKKW